MGQSLPLSLDFKSRVFSAKRSILSPFTKEYCARGTQIGISLDLKEEHYNDGHCSCFLKPIWLCLPFSFSFPPSFSQSICIFCY